MAATSQKKSVLEQVKTDLFSSEAKVVTRALGKVDSQGDHTLVRPLVELWFTINDDAIKTKVSGMLNQLKISKADDELMDCIRDERYAPVRAQLLAFIWNSGFTPDEHMPELCHIAMNGTFEETFECLTIIESMAPPVADVPLTEATLQVREFLASCEDDTRKELMLTIYQTLKEFADADDE